MDSGRAPLSDRGVELAWDRRGAGCVLVWAHGLSSSRAAEETLSIVDTQRLAKSCDVVRYDSRGHGESTATDDPSASSWHHMAADQLALAGFLGVERYVAAGASLGAATALHAAVQAPHRIDALVLVIPPTAWETRRPQIELYRSMADIVATDGVEPLVAGIGSVPPPDPFRDLDGWEQGLAASMRAADPRRLAAVYRGAAHADLPDPAAVAAITAPALILAWTGDPGHPLSTAERLHDLLPTSELGVASSLAEVGTWTDRIAEFVGGLS